MKMKKAELEILMRQALEDTDHPLFASISFVLALMVDAQDRGDGYSRALHHQKVCELLDRYARTSGHKSCAPPSRSDSTMPRPAR